MDIRVTPRDRTAKPARPVFTFRTTIVAAAVALAFTSAHAIPVTWVPNADGYWDIASNWSSTPSLPGNADDVAIDVGGSTIRTITHRSGTHTINSLSSKEALVISGGSLTVNNAFTSDAVDKPNTQVSGATLTLNGSSSLNALTLSSGVIKGSGAVAVAGMFTWTGGTMGISGSPQGITYANGGVTLSTGTKALTARTLNIASGTTADWSGGTIAMTTQSGVGAGIIANAGTWNDKLTSNNSITVTAGGSGAAPNRFDNTGTYTKTGAATTMILAQFNNDSSAGAGIVNVNAGILSLGGGGTSNGSFSVASGGTLNFSGGTHALQAGSTIIGAGAVTFSGAGTTNMAGLLAPTGLVTVSGGTVNWTGTQTLADATFSGGTTNLNGSFSATGVIAVNGSGAVVNLDAPSALAGSLNIIAGKTSFNAAIGAAALSQSGGTIAGSGTLSVSGTATLTGGNHANGGTATTTGRTVLAGGGSIAGNLGVDDGRRLQIGDGASASAVVWSAGTIQLNPNAGGQAAAGILSTAAGAVLSTGFDGYILTTNRGGADNGASARFDNTGTLVKTGGIGTTTVGVALNNNGTLNAQSGTILLSGGGTNSGSFSAAAGASIDFSGTYSLGTGATLSGDGSVLPVAATKTLTVAGDASTQRFTMTGGTLNGAGTLTIAGSGRLTGGTLAGSGALQVTSGATLLMTSDTGSGSEVDLNGRNLNVAAGGSLIFADNGTYNPRMAFQGGAQLSNAGTFSDQSTGNWAFNHLGALLSSAINNTGIYSKTGGSERDFEIPFNNNRTATPGTGIVNVDSGSSLWFKSGGAANGTFDVASGAALVFMSGFQTPYALKDGASIIGAGIAQFKGHVTVDGNVGINSAEFSGTILGQGTLILNGNGTWRGSQMSDAGTTLIANGASMDILFDVSTDPMFTSHFLTSGRTLSIAPGGTVTWTNDGAVSGAYYSGEIYVSGAQISNAGLFQDQTVASTRLTANLGGNNSAGAFNNSGVFAKSGASTTSIESGVSFTNTGVVNVNAGVLQIANPTQLSGGTLAGGTWNVNGATLSLAGDAPILTNKGNITLSGTTSAFPGLQSIQDNQGYISIQNGRDFTTYASLTNSGMIVVGAGSTMNVSGAMPHSGVLFAAGTVNAIGGISGPGTVQIDPSGHLDLGAPSAVGVLVHNGASANALNLGANDITVSVDYQNANFGSGDSFNRRANVAGTGLILSASPGAATQQGVTGDVVGGFTTGDAIINFGNVHVGDRATRSFQITNAGGPVLRGAIQTVVNGGNITDARLSGSGVTAGSFGAIAAGGASDVYQVTFAPTWAGDLIGQKIAIINNFDNTNTQTITFLNSTAYALAKASTVAPVDFGAVRLNSFAGRGLSITNLAANDGYSEKLNAAVTTNDPGVVFAGGTFKLLDPQQTSNTDLGVAIHTGSAGHKSGSVTIALESDGTGTSGLGKTSLGTQVVNVSGDVYGLANPVLNTIDLSLAARVGDPSPVRLVSVSNSSTDSYTEGLNAAFSAAPAAFVAAGNVNNLGAGRTSPDQLQIGLNTGASVNASGVATVSFVSTGTGTTGAPDQPVGSATVAVTGKVYSPAQVQAPASVDFGIVHKGDTAVRRAVAVSNSAPVLELNDVLVSNGFSASAPFHATGQLSGVVAGATDNASLLVSLDTTNAGFHTGTATLDLASRNADLPDLALATSTIALTGQVNNFANPVFRQDGGAGAFSGAGAAYTLNLGQLTVGSGPIFAELSVANSVSASEPADLLDGSFSFDGQAKFQLTGFDSFQGLAAGQATAPLRVTLDPASSGTGTFNEQITLSAVGHNASPYSAAFGDIRLTVQGSVVAVPEPRTYALLLTGIGALGWLTRRRGAGRKG